MTKMDNRVSLEKANHAIGSAAHSLVTEGFNVTGEDRDLVRLVLTGKRTESQFRAAVKARYDV